MQGMRDHFLLAMPQLEDENFAGSLVYLCDHDSKGLLGVIVNRPLALTLSDLFGQLDLDDHDAPLAVRQQAVLFGGPVHHDRGFVLHRGRAAEWSSSLQVTDEVALTTSLDILQALAEGNGPEDFLVCLGCAGWEEGQWVDEMKANAWLTLPAVSSVLFDTEADERCEAAALAQGMDLARLSQQVGHA